MKNEINPNLPLEFQKIIRVEKQEKTNSEKSFVKVDFYQSRVVFPDNFHKPISKITNFDF